jgi:NADPH-dependent curcumin reductase CurA
LVSQYGNQDGLDPRDQWRKKGEQVFTRQQVQVHDLFVGNYVTDYQETFLDEVGEYVRSGRLTYREDLRPRLEQAPEVFAQMLKGDNFGKTLIGVSQDPTQSG